MWKAEEMAGVRLVSDCGNTWDYGSQTVAASTCEQQSPFKTYGYVALNNHTNRRWKANEFGSGHDSWASKWPTFHLSNLWINTWIKLRLVQQTLNGAPNVCYTSRLAGQKRFGKTIWSNDLMAFKYVVT